MRHHRQNRRSHGNRIAAKHQLHHPVGIIQRGQAPFRHDAGCGKSRIDQQVDLCHANPKQSWNHQPRHIANSWMRERNSKFELHPFLHKQRHLNQELQHSADQNAHRQRCCRIFEILPDRRNRKQDRRQVPEHRGQRGHREVLVAVQDSDDDPRDAEPRKISTER